MFKFKDLVRWRCGFVKIMQLMACVKPDEPPEPDPELDRLWEQVFVPPKKPYSVIIDGLMIKIE